MSHPGKVPVISESAFRREYMLIWAATGAGCLFVGLAIAPQVIRARGSWISSLMAIGVYLFSLLICPLVLSAVWQRPHVTPPVLYFSIPVGGVAVATVGLIRWLGPGLGLGRRTMACFAISVGLLYAASLVWSVGLGIRRKKLGHIEIEKR